jgi:Cytochrome P450
MKRIFQPSFSSEQINKLRPFVEDLCNDLIDKAKAKGSFDIIADYAYPIPFIVVAKLLGLPSEDLPRIRQWCKEILALWDVGTAPSSQAQKCVDEYTKYVLPLVAQRRKEFRDDFLSSMTLADRDGFRLTDQQIASNAVLFTFAGFETTEGLIGNGMFALLRNRDQLELLQEDPSLIDVTVEECLRYDTPAQLHLKVMLEDIEVRGKVLRKNDKVLTFTGAANRDPEVFSEPDKFLIRRSDNKHLAFGSGIHYCIGAPLSRMEAQVAIGILVQRLPEIRLATDQISYRQVYRPRAIESLPVLF